jgi:hypothetical protein
MEPKTTSAFREGKAAAAEGKDADANPYDRNTPEYVDWREGYQFVREFQEDGEIPSET